MTDRFDLIRLLEALLFASAEPLTPAQLARHLPEGTAIEGLIEELAGLYANRGVNLVPVDKAWAFRTAPDLAPRMRLEKSATRKLSRVAMETLAIIAYHQPITRAEIEEIRGVSLSKGTLDVLLEAGWVRPRGRRRSPGRPVTWGTSQDFLDHFGLAAVEDLPGVAELKAAGLIDARPALTALEARGRLPAAGEIEQKGRPDDGDADGGEDGGDGDPPLPADFGEDLLDEAAEEDQGEAEEAAAGR